MVPHEKSLPSSDPIHIPFRPSPLHQTWRQPWRSIQPPVPPVPPRERADDLEFFRHPVVDETDTSQAVTSNNVAHGRSSNFSTGKSATNGMWITYNVGKSATNLHFGSWASRKNHLWLVRMGEVPSISWRLLKGTACHQWDICHGQGYPISHHDIPMISQVMGISIVMGLPPLSLDGWLSWKIPSRNGWWLGFRPTPIYGKPRISPMFLFLQRQDLDEVVTSVARLDTRHLNEQAWNLGTLW